VGGKGRGAVLCQPRTQALWFVSIKLIHAAHAKATQAIEQHIAPGYEAGIVCKKLQWSTYKLKLHVSQQLPVAKPASCPPENFWNIDPRNAICSNLSIKFQKIAWSNDGERCGYFGIFQTTIMKIDTKLGNLWSAVPLIIVTPAIVHFFSIRKYYMHVLY
jgi:hypothetical protein